jgi:hypothetical protein
MGTGRSAAQQRQQRTQKHARMAAKKVRDIEFDIHTEDSDEKK